MTKYSVAPCSKYNESAIYMYITGAWHLCMNLWHIRLIRLIKSKLVNKIKIKYYSFKNTCRERKLSCVDTSGNRNILVTKCLIKWVPKHICTEMPCHRWSSINFGCCRHLGMETNRGSPKVYNKVGLMW